MTEKHREEALRVLKEILHLLHEKRFDEVRSVVCESEIDDLGDVLTEYLQGNLEVSGFDVIDEYGAPSPFRPHCAEALASQLEFYEYDDASGFAMDYNMTSDSDDVGIVLQLSFIYQKDGSLKSIFVAFDID